MLPDYVYRVEVSLFRKNADFPSRKKKTPGSPVVETKPADITELN